MARLLKDLADLMAVGMMFPVSIGLGLLIGSAIDAWLETKPAFTLIFVFFGIAAAFLNLIRTVSRQRR